MLFVVQEVSEPFAPEPRVTATPIEAVNPLPIVLFAAWTIGFVAIVSRWFFRCRLVRAAVRNGTALDLPIGIEVVSSPALLEPGVFGIRKPVLLLPDGITDRLTPTQLNAIVAHELCHVRRRDNLATAIHMIVEAVFWFHPLVWWLGARLVEERERACDQEVLRMGSEPQTYAEGILEVCKFYLESPLECVAGVTGANLKKRIEDIMSHRIAQKLNGGKKLLLATVGMLAVVVPLGVGVINVRAQSTPAPKFEVAAIRRCENADPEVRGGGGNSSPGRLNANCQSVRGFIQAAYLLFANGRVNPSASSTPIEGGPAWINSERYTINAKAEGDASVEMMQGPMLQALLEDRFKLKIRREARQIPVYALTAAKSGFKLHRLEDGSCTPRDPTKPLMPLEPGQKPRCGAAKGGRKGPNLTWEVQASLEELSKVLTISLDRPVVDKSGITGRFDFHLEFAIDDTTRKEAAAMPAAPSDDPAGPSIFTALQELGLKLEPTKGPGEFLVIDHVERPSEN